MDKTKVFHPKTTLKLAAVVFTLSLLSGCMQVVDLKIPEKTQTKIPTSTLEKESLLSEGIKGTQSQALLDEKSDPEDLPDLPYYQITVNVDPVESEFTGEMELEYQNLENIKLSELNFRLFPNGGKSYGRGTLHVNQVYGPDEIPLEYKLSLGDTVLSVLLPESIDPGESLKVRINFEGKIPTENDDPGYGLYSSRENVIALSGWYPILAVYDDEGWNLDPVSGIGDSVYSDAAYYDVRVTIPEKYKIAATGNLINSELLESENVQNRYISGPARDFFLILSSKFLTVTRKIDGTIVTVYYRSGQKEGAEKAAEVASDSIEVFNKRFGIYPYQELDLVAAPLNYAAGIEFPGVILVESDYFNSADELFFQIVTAHEVAHQWFYNLVGSDVIDEPWLDEALVTYASNLYFEEIYGRELYNDLIAYYEEVVAEAEENGFEEQITRSLGYFESTEQGRAAYSPMVYSKGALFFHELREQMGDESFFQAIQNYFRMNQYGIGTPEELLGSFLDFADRDLNPLFLEWLSISLE